MNYNDYPSEEKSIPWKAVLIVGGGLVAAIAIVWIVWRVISGSKSTSIDLTQIIKQRVVAIESACENTQDPELCKKIQLEATALAEQNPELCRELEGDDKDGCIWEVASDSQNASICDGMENEPKRQICADGIAYDLARASGDSAMCAKIKEEELRNGCVRILDPITAENCASKNQDPAYCHFLDVRDLAITKQDRRICDELEGEELDICRDIVSIDDPDFDGLSTDEELFQYNTNPDVADTDGDGYLDGAEVEAGYNPNGPGLLTEESL